MWFWWWKRDSTEKFATYIIKDEGGRGRGREGRRVVRQKVGREGKGEGKVCRNNCLGGLERKDKGNEGGGGKRRREGQKDYMIGGGW